jgi:folate-binding protein YgfZ
MQHVTFHGWRPAAWLRISGEDAGNFLQGQFTNDLRTLQAGDGAAVYGLWLNQKGRVLADGFVLAAGDGAFWVGSYFSPAEVIRARLEDYIIADDVTVEDATANWEAVTVFAGAGDGFAAEAGANFLRFAGRRAESPCTEWIFPSSDGARVRARLEGGRELDRVEMERMRIGAGLPAVPGDIGPADLPNEGGLELSAISYTKGCYLGQEVMARLKSLGQVRRRLLRVRGPGAVPARLAALYQGGQKVGEMRTAAAENGGFSGFAMVTLLNLRRDTGASFAPDAAPTVFVVDQP